MKRTAVVVLLASSVAMLASCAQERRIELTEAQAATIHDCFDNGWLARVTFDESRRAEVICVAAY